MTHRRDRLVVIASLCFAGGLVAGLLLAWAIEDDTASGTSIVAGDERDVDRSAEHLPTLETGGLPVSGDVTGSRDARTAADPEPWRDVAPAARASAGPSMPPGVAGWILVEVAARSDGSPVSGEAYVLGAGRPGVEDVDLVPHASVNSEEAARIPVAHPGRYDVGLAWRHRHLLRRDVHVVAGETTRVGFTFEMGEPLHVTLEGDLPSGPDGPVRVHLSARPTSEDARTSYYPGRNERRRMASGTLLQPGYQEVELLGPGERARLHAQVQSGRLGARRGPAAEPLAAVCEPAVVAPGARVRVRIVEAGFVELALRLDLASWPVDVSEDVAVELRVGDAWVKRVDTTLQRRASMTREDVFRLRVLAPRGALHASWGGPHVQAGAAPAVTVHAGGTTEVAGTLVYAGPPVAAGRGVHLEVAWPPHLEPGDELQLTDAGRPRPRADDAPPSWDVPLDAPRPYPLGAHLRGPVLAVVGRRWASAPLEVPDGGPLHVRLREGGLLAVVPEIERSEGMGVLRLRRHDGLPVLDRQEGWRSVVRATTGRLLGPFPPGAYRFQVWIGQHRLPDVQAVVRAGRTTPLVIPD